MEMQLFNWRNRQPLTEHYIHQYTQVEQLFEYNVWEASEWKRRAKNLEANKASQTYRHSLVEALIAYNKKIGNEPSTIASIKQLERLDASVIIGGQQAGLFLGPAMIVHKVLTILRSARDQANQLGRPVLPVFWIAGEDHDWDEVNHIYCRLGASSVPRKLRLEAQEGHGHNAVSLVKIHTEEWMKALRGLGAALEDTAFKSDLMQRLEDIHLSSDTLSTAFARMLAWLFGKHGLIVLDAADPGIRKLESEMFEKIVTAHVNLNASLQLGKANVEALGYVPQVELHPQSAQLFVLHEHQRKLLFRQGEDYVDKQGVRIASEQVLINWAKHEPEKLSNNVVTRPLMQEFLLPVLATVLGPAELAYWAMLKPAFETFNMQMPIILPRSEFTVLDRTSQKLMQRFHLDFDDVVHRLQSKREAWIGGLGGDDWDEAFNQVKQNVIDVYQPLLERIRSEYPGLHKLSERNEAKILEQVEYLRRKTQETLRTKHQVAIDQWNRLEVSLLPFGKPQERVYPIWMYVNEYGMDWLDQLVAATPECIGGHYTIKM